jgi:hypothetical protein
MAVIRLPSGKRFRHFGSPDRDPAEQPAKGKVWSTHRSDPTMKAIMLLLFGLVLTVFVAMLATVFMWFAWNHGMVPALSFAKEISVLQAFCLSLCIATIGGMFKSTLTVNSKE